MVTASGASGHSRVRRALLFLTVVWSIGAAFLALEASLTELSSLGSSKVLPANIVLPRQSKASLMHCEEVVKGLSPPPQDANVAGQASYLAWSLGYLMGSADASITSGVANRAAGENVLRRSLPVTTFLGIPPLALPKHGRSAYALREFSEFLEEDTACVATALQLRHSPKHAALYKFGAAVGFASVYRRLMPQLNDVLAPEIRVYGSTTGIPANLYDPLLGKQLAGRGADENRAIQSVVIRIDSYIKSTN